MSDTQRRSLEARLEKYRPPEGVDWREYNRELLEREANSDAPDAWVFDRLLAQLDEEGES